MKTLLIKLSVSMIAWIAFGELYDESRNNRFQWFGHDENLAIGVALKLQHTVGRRDKFTWTLL